jgi:hypothetical protein
MDRILAHALGDDIDGVLQTQISRTLGAVWFTALIGWVNGWSGMEKVADELELAAHLMLDQYDR